MILTIVLLLCAAPEIGAQTVRGPFAVVSVVDGDTIAVLSPRGTERVRLIGIDCPELGHADPAIRVYAQLAAEFTTTRLLGGDVWLEADVREADQFGRTLAYVWTTPPPAEGASELLHTHMFSAVLMYEGWAMTYTVPPNVKYSHILAALGRDAMENARGLWKDPGEVIEAYDLVYRTATGGKYHVLGCEYLATSCIEITRLEGALRELAPCSSCSPTALTLRP